MIRFELISKRLKKHYQVDIEPTIIKVYDNKESISIIEDSNMTFKGLIEFLKKYETVGLSS